MHLWSISLKIFAPEFKFDRILFHLRLKFNILITTMYVYMARYLCFCSQYKTLQRRDGQGIDCNKNGFSPTLNYGVNFFCKKGPWCVADSPTKTNSQNSDVPNSLNIYSDENVVCFLFLNRRYTNIMVCDKSLMTSPCWLKWCLGVARQQAKIPDPMLIHVYVSPYMSSTWFHLRTMFSCRANMIKY